MIDSQARYVCVDSLFYRPAAHAAAGQGEGWCLQGMAI